MCSFQPLMRKNGSYAQRCPQKLWAVIDTSLDGYSTEGWPMSVGQEWMNGRVKRRALSYSDSSSFSATVLICAQTRCPGLIPRFTSDFLVMLATRGAPISNNTSTDD
jgi:hypothetical protein